MDFDDMAQSWSYLRINSSTLQKSSWI